MDTSQKIKTFALEYLAVRKRGVKTKNICAEAIALGGVCDLVGPYLSATEYEIVLHTLRYIFFRSYKNQSYPFDKEPGVFIADKNKAANGERVRFVRRIARGDFDKDFDR